MQFIDYQLYFLDPNDKITDKWKNCNLNIDLNCRVADRNGLLTVITQGAVEMWLYNNGDPNTNYQVIEATTDEKYLFQLGLVAGKLNVDIYPLNRDNGSSVSFLANSAHYRADISSLPALTQFTHIVLQGNLLGTASATPPPLYVNGTAVTMTASTDPAPISGFTVSADVGNINYPDNLTTLKHLRLYTHLLSALDIANNAANTYFMTNDKVYAGWYRFNTPAAGSPTTVDANSTLESTMWDSFAGHGLPTTYAYNGTNQVVTQNSPDGGTNNFWYDMLSRLVISQNDKQKNTSPIAIRNTMIWVGLPRLARKRQMALALGRPDI